MSVDPYHAVQSEIQSSLATAEQLRASFIRIRSTAREGSEELEWARNEVSTQYVLVRVGIILTAPR
jgi:Syntaxin 6, N-terminal